MSTFNHLATPGSVAAVSVFVSGLLYTLEKRYNWIKPVVKFAENHKGLIGEGVSAAEAGFATIMHSPEVEALKLDLEHKASELEKTKLGKLASDVIREAGTRVEKLTPKQRTGYALVLTTEAAKAGVNITHDEALQAIDDLQKAGADIANSKLFQDVKAIDVPATAPASTPVEAPATTA